MELEPGEDAACTRCLFLPAGVPGVDADGPNNFLPVPSPYEVGAHVGRWLHGGSTPCQSQSTTHHTHVHHQTCAPNSRTRAALAAIVCCAAGTLIIVISDQPGG